MRPVIISKSANSKEDKFYNTVSMGKEVEKDVRENTQVRLTMTNSEAMKDGRVPEKPLLPKIKRRSGANRPAMS